jgi:hypothetical protein
VRFFLLLLAFVLASCGVEAEVRHSMIYNCNSVIGPIGSNHPVNCDVVGMNAIAAYNLMSVLPEFVASLADIDQIRIREEASWSVSWSNQLKIGVTVGPLFDGAEMEIDSGMRSLAHELEHVRLHHLIGDYDPNHLWWHTTGQDQRDLIYGDMAIKP